MDRKCIDKDHFKVEFYFKQRILKNIFLEYFKFQKLKNKNKTNKNNLNISTYTGLSFLKDWLFKSLSNLKFS